MLNITLIIFVYITYFNDTLDILDYINTLLKLI